MIRGMIQNKRVEISNDEAQRFLKMGKVAHVATVDEEGYPKIELFEVQIEKLTGKINHGMYH
ncbi:hypothetical protein [Lysinibacillus fusiformis]|uniref:hypothetical protein n=1 Tax=Lysinibacillus fusiformis TaxID=28031 RepID=UPI0034E1F159|nr:hypothetical protein [Lysinibacillus fusiformis]MCT6928369.1 hypothetical protein [Lysinibacillus fusiformis]MCT6933522.1 hypothetical protein [Lysinibacillus fusiformis]